MTMCNSVLYFFVILIITVNHAQSFVKIFWQNQSIYEQKFWIPLDEEDCEGLIFPSNPSGLETIDKLNVQRIVLPNHGNILLSMDSEIILDLKSTDKMNCATLNETEFNEVMWSDITNWIMEGYEDNVAVPNVERLPCEYDDVVLPYGIYTKAFSIYGYQQIRVKSFKFGDSYWTSEDLAYYTKESSVISYIIKVYGDLLVGNKECPDPTGCVCGNNLDVSVCWYTPSFTQDDSEKKFDCINPIKPIGFCIEMCGATIRFKPKKHFKLNEFREKLKHYTSDVYASKVEDGQLQFIQVVFAEKVFTGISLTEATDLHTQMIADSSWGTRNATLETSGPFYKEGAELKGALFSVFGTLLTVLVAFGLIYLIFATTIFDTFRNRIHLGSTLDSSQFSKYFARYKASDAGLIIEVQSRAESIVNLERSFENPLYERTSPSTSTTSDDTGAELIESLPKIETENDIPSCSFEVHHKLEEEDPDKTELINLS